LWPEAKELLLPAFDAMGLTHVEGAGNFVMVQTPVSDSLVYRQLMRQGVMVRTMTGFRFPNWIRVSLTQPPAMRDFLTAFTKVVAQARQDGSA